MSELSDRLLILENAAVQPGPSQFKTAAAPGMPSGFMVGISQDRAHHLLIPIGSRRLVPDRRSRHLVLEEQELTMPDGRVQRHADLRCDDPELFGVFGYVLDDVAARLGQAGHVDAVQTCREVLSDWRELTAGGNPGPGRETEMGLFGELSVLSRLGARDPFSALATWKGPDGASWDFSSNGRAIEVKTTATVSGSTVKVSNIEQLDPAGLDRLDLVVVHVREDEVGESVDELIDRLVAAGFNPRALLMQVAKVGHTYGHAGRRGYVTNGLHRWRVSQDFPSLRRADIPASKAHALLKITYTLALPSGSVDLDEPGSVRWLERWVDA